MFCQSSLSTFLFPQAAARWVVPDLQGTIRSLKEARENRNTAIKDFKNRLFAEFDADRSVWLRAIRVLSELDCLFSLAKASSALGEPACRPELVEGDEAFIDFTRPVKEELLKNAVISYLGTASDFTETDFTLVISPAIVTPKHDERPTRFIGEC